MALRTSKVSAYCSNIRQLTSRLSVLSVQQPAVERVVLEPVVHNDVVGVKNVLTSKKFPFPGGVTSQAAYKSMPVEAEIVGSVQPMKATEADIKLGDVSEKRIELKVVACPESMKAKVGDLFPEQNVDGLSVLNVTQKTQNDMSAWNANMEVEWMAVSSGFTESAVAACNALKAFGYWADFIDPTSGKPYLSKTKTEVTLNVTDDEYRSLGYDIADMGCCKILKHATWGKQVFVGTIFTNAPIDSPAVKEILARVNAD